MAVILNPDKEIVKTVKEGLKRTGGYCPCRTARTDDYKCMCKEFRDQIKDDNFEGYCHCMLYYKSKGIKEGLAVNEVKITKNNFEQEVLNSDKPVLVDFWAAWCGPCKMLSPIISEIAEELEGQVTVGKVNVDEEMDLAVEFNIVSIPTLMVFKNGRAVNTSVGFQQKEEIKEMLGL